MTFHSVGNVIIPTDEVLFFKMVIAPPTRRPDNMARTKPSGSLWVDIIGHHFERTPQ